MDLAKARSNVYDSFERATKRGLQKEGCLLLLRGGGGGKKMCEKCDKDQKV